MGSEMCIRDRALDFGGKTREEMEALMMTNPRAVYSAIDRGILDESVGYALQGAVERPARQRTQRTQVKPRKATPFPLVSALKNTQDPVEQLRFQYEQKGSQPLKIGRGGLSQTAMEKTMAETPAAVFKAIDQGILDESVGYALQGTRRKN